MNNERLNFIGDPFNNDLITSGQYPQIKSTGYSGTYSDITAPSTANYPNISPTRYFIRLPVIPDLTDLSGTRPMLIKDLTTATVLTKVSSAPSTNQYSVAPATSRSPDIIELNSGQANHSIGFSYYGTGSIYHAEDYNNPNVQGTLTTQYLTVANSVVGTALFSGLINPSGGVVSVGVSNSGTVYTIEGIKTAYIDIGTWNMNSSRTLTVNITTSWTFASIYSIECIIRGDDGNYSNGCYNHTATPSTELEIYNFKKTGGIVTCSLSVQASSFYNINSNYTSTGASRGFLKVDYL